MGEANRIGIAALQAAGMQVTKTQAVSLGLRILHLWRREWEARNLR